MIEQLIFRDSANLVEETFVRFAIVRLIVWWIRQIRLSISFHLSQKRYLKVWKIYDLPSFMISAGLERFIAQ